MIDIKRERAGEKTSSELLPDISFMVHHLIFSHFLLLLFSVFFRAVPNSERARAVDVAD